nr:2,3-dihydroxybiphenyl 1,2-dioxygenase [Gammaproteobacteria bacterium]NIO62828.1 2,3-dihydroxybiphenyl 1,2-dioxygenase [Gammaproteobacteria bacterium]
MSQVKALGYIGCTVSDIAAWDDLIDTVFGLEKRKDSAKGYHQYRVDDYHHRLTLRESKKDKL